MKGYAHAYIVTCNAKFDVFEDGLLIENNGEIIYCGPYQEQLAQQCDTIIDYSKCWLMPGLVNVHTHNLMTLLRGIQDDSDLMTWLNHYIWPNEAKFTPKLTKAAVELALIEMLKSGTTTFNDMYNPHGVEIKHIYDSVKQSGMRCYFSPTLFSQPNETTIQTLTRTKAIIEEILAYNNDKFQVMVAPHAPYTCDKELLVGALKLAKDKALMLHIHTAETATETQIMLERCGQRTIAYLDELGYLEHPTVMAHCVELTDEEIARLAQSQARVAHNPISNLKLASGVAPIAKLLQHNVKVGIATDSVASNNNLDMFEEGRQAALLQKGHNKDAQLMTIEQTLKAMTIQGAEVLNMNHMIGSLEQGKRADFIVINPQNKAHLYPTQHVLSHLVYAVKGSDVQDVYIDGQCVVAKGVVQVFDEQFVLQQANEYYENIIDKH